jgi:hypothetical protein
MRHPRAALLILAHVCLVTVACGKGCRAEDPAPAQQANGAAGAQDAATAGSATADGGSGPAQPGAAAAASAVAPPGGPGVVSRVPACRLVARREVQQILGSPIGRPMPEEAPGTTRCIYPPAQIAPRTQAQVTIEWDSPRTGPSVAEQLADVGQGTEPGPQVAQRVALGDGAVWSLDGELAVRVGAALVTVVVTMGPESRRQTEAIARKIVDRLGGAPLPDPTDDEPDAGDDETMPNLDGLLSPKPHD